MNPAESKSAPLAVAVKILRALALIGLGLGLTLVIDLGLLSHLPSSSGFFERFLDRWHPTVEVGLPLAWAAWLLSVAVIVGAIRRLPLRSARGWLALSLIATGICVANLVLVAQFSSLRDGFAAVADFSFWRTNGLTLELIAVTLLAIGTAAWLLRPTTGRGVVLLGLVMASILVLDLVVAAFWPALAEVVTHLPQTMFAHADGETLGDVEVALGLFGFLPLLMFAAFWRLRRCSCWWIAGGYLVVGSTLVYLARDDAKISRPLTLEEVAPSFPGADASFGVLMRYGLNHPLGHEFRAPQRIYHPIAADEANDPSRPVEWQNWLTRHRADLEADWSDLAPVRAWWTELNSFDRIGDLTAAHGTIELVAFSPIRSMSQHGCAIASLQALDGHGDEAVNTLLPVLQVGRKLQPSSRTLVRQMIAIIVERMSVATASFILDHAAISAPARARLVAALAPPDDATAGARRLIAAEYAYHVESSLDRPLGDLLDRKPDWLRHSLNCVSPFVYNPRATINLYGDFAAMAEDCLARRQVDVMDTQARQFVTAQVRPHFKNLVGTQVLGAMIPAYKKVGESYWKTQDVRAALLARLTNS